eukprot:4909444-Amphidinium_carterae.1
MQDTKAAASISIGDNKPPFDFSTDPHRKLLPGCWQRWHDWAIRSVLLGSGDGRKSEALALPLGRSSNASRSVCVSRFKLAGNLGDFEDLEPKL